jgi:predicted ATP-grasp superfamily ATP-dependent carboligase
VAPRRRGRFGIPAPRTAPEPTEAFGFPVLLKPSRPDDFRRAFGVKAFRCKTAAELADSWERAQPFEPAVWEWIPGGDEAL